MTKYALAAAALAVVLTPATFAKATVTESTPIINNVDPATPAPNPKAAQVLTITGQDFMAGLTLTVSEPAGNKMVIQGKAITNQTAQSFQAAVTLTQEGTYSLVVTNTDGGISPPFAVPVKPRQPPQGPAIEKITPAEPTKRQDAQPLLVEGQRFSAGLRAIVTDPMGADVTELQVGKVTPNSFELTVRLEHSGEYTLVVTNPSGAVSNTRRILVR
jgi:hypothetical protein